MRFVDLNDLIYYIELQEYNEAIHAFEQDGSIFIELKYPADFNTANVCNYYDNLKLMRDSDNLLSGYKWIKYTPKECF